MRFSIDPKNGRSPRDFGGSVLGLYDAPLYRDWLAWWTFGLVATAGIGSVTAPADQQTNGGSLPAWLNALIVVVVSIGLFGLVPAYLRLLWRRRRFRLSRVGHIPSPSPLRPSDMPTAEPTATGTNSVSSASAQHDRGDLPTTLPPAGDTAPSRPVPTRPQLLGAPAVPMRLIDVEAVCASSALSNAREVFPYPVARAARAVQLATDSKDLYESILRTSETLAIVLGITATAWARHYNVVTDDLRSLQQAFVSRGVSQGHWTAAARSIERSMSDHPDALPGMANALRPGKGGRGLLFDLDLLLRERNRWAHGAGPHNRVEAAERALTLSQGLERCLKAAQFMAGIPWILTQDSQLRRRERDFQIRASRAMGDHPDFENITFVASTPLADDVFYLLITPTAIDLTPLVVIRHCPTCRQREVSYADRVDDRDGVSLKSFDRGHLLFDPGLSDELRRLFPTQEDDNPKGQVV